MELFFIGTKSTLYLSILISIIEIDCGEMVSHIGISIGTDMIFGGIGQTIRSTIGIIGTMDGWIW